MAETAFNKPIIITFVILTWNSKPHIERCLDSIYHNMNHRQNTFEVLVVDNGSKDGTVDLLKIYASQAPDVVKPIFLSTNTGTTHSRNLALKQAVGEYICILDSDVDVPDGTIAQLMTVLRNDPSIGLISPRLTYGDGSLQKSTDDFPTIFSKFFRFFFLKFQEQVEQQREEFTSARDVDYTISAFWLFRRSLIDLIGLLDENIFYAPEDVDYCLRIWKSGLRVVYEPSVSAIHNAQEISRKILINLSTIEHIKGLAYYFKKHGYCLSKPAMKKN